LKKEDPRAKPEQEIRQPQTIGAKILRFMDAAPPEVLEDLLAVEAPLETRIQYTRKDGHTVNRPVSLTMRTPGDDPELALGYLYNEGILQSPCDLDCPPFHTSPNEIGIRLKSPPSHNLAHQIESGSKNLTNSSCGICSNTSMESLGRPDTHPIPHPAQPTIRPETLYALPGQLLRTQTAFSQTGGIHAAALFDPTGQLLAMKEDIGRHNAVDKVGGHLFLKSQLPSPANTLLLVSGRTSYEIVQKTLRMGIPVLAGIGPPSSMAVELANAGNLTLVGFLSENKSNVYSCPERIVIQ
jgi:FdhD protein